MNKVTRALIVNISDYEPHHETGQECDLNGPGNDADKVESKIHTVELQDLQKQLLTASNKQRRRVRRKIRRLNRGKVASSRVKVRELCDRHATAKTIRQEFAEFCKRIPAGEAGIFYRSGHGSYIGNDVTEADGTCEVFCAYDFLNGGYIQDDEFQAIINEFLHPKAQLVVLIDTCHAGDSMKSATLEMQRGVAAPYKATPKTFVNSDKNPRNVIVWAACAPNQVAWERPYNDLVYGAFTFAIADYIPEIVRGTINWELAHTNVCKVLDIAENNKGGQTPQLERFA